MKLSPALLILPGLLLALGSCASAPDVVDPSGIDVTFREMKAGDLLRYSVDKGLNPYTNVGMLIRRPDDFLVLRVMMTTNRPLTFEIASLDAYDAGGQKIATFNDRRIFLEHLKKWTTDPADFTRLEGEVNRTYLPYGTLRFRSGKRGYILVLIGKHPMPQAVTLRGLAFIDNSTTDFEVTLPID